MRFPVASDHEYDEVLGIRLDDALRRCKTVIMFHFVKIAPRVNLTGGGGGGRGRYFDRLAVSSANLEASPIWFVGYNEMAERKCGAVMVEQVL